MLTNCVRVRHAHNNEPFGVAFDFAMSTINHSCSPNAFMFLEDGSLRVRSLTRIKPGDEITISYIDPTIYVTKRLELIKLSHLFQCHCTYEPNTQNTNRMH